MTSRIVFCTRCRGMRAGWNKRYILHWLLCTQWLCNSSRLRNLAIATAALLLAFPESTIVFSSDRLDQPIQKVGVRARIYAMSSSPDVRSMEAFLARHEVREANRSRLAASIVTSARKYNLDPRLIASITIVESRGNPFAISSKNAIGIMQIHLPTWGETVDREGINLLKIEDNIDFGARILKNYVGQFGLWEGVKRYNGFIADNPISEQSAEDYVAKVQRIYGFQQPVTSQAALL
jgi:soluble lytic murein transglycosylase-like protein